jgi:hypothetical protein
LYHGYQLKRLQPVPMAQHLLALRAEVDEFLDLLLGAGLGVASSTVVQDVRPGSSAPSPSRVSPGSSAPARCPPILVRDRCPLARTNDHAKAVLMRSSCQVIIVDFVAHQTFWRPEVKVTMLRSEDGQSAQSTVDVCNAMRDRMWQVLY